MDKERYIKFLKNEKNLSDNTCKAYLQDILNFKNFLVSRGTVDLKEVSNTDLLSYVVKLRNDDISKTTIKRRLASIRTYYQFLIGIKEIESDPTLNIKSPKSSKKEIEYISVSDMENVLNIPDDSKKGIRDRAILELMYATGMRATEIINAKLNDVNTKMGFISVNDTSSKNRIIPLGKFSRSALDSYILNSRKDILKNIDSDFLFISTKGDPLTRQGLWKIIKEYGEKAGLTISLTPQVIRNSFAVHMLSNGADLKTISELMGHDDISAVQIYLSALKIKVKDVYDRTHPRA